MRLLSAAGHDGGAWSAQQLSDLAGSASFVVWLFAQSPQLYENYRNASCEGLSIVFLAQWMAGDVTNLVGSVLTQQLPFQIAVATYFCCIDACILMQYYYYWQRDRRLAKQKEKYARRYQYGYNMTRAYDTLPNLHSSSRGLHSSARALLERGSSVQSTRSTRPVAEEEHQSRPSLQPQHRRSRSGSLIRYGTTGSRPARLRLTSELDTSYRALGEAAKSVAELASETDRRMAKREARMRRAWAKAVAENDSARGIRTAKMTDATNTPGGTGYDDEDEDSDAPAHMTASVVTSSSNGGTPNNFGYGFASVPDLRAASSARDAGSAPSSPDKRRGRDMRRMAARMTALDREVADDGNGHGGMSPLRRLLSSSRPAVSRSSTRSTLSPLSARQSGMVLLSITALLSWNRPTVQSSMSLAPAASFSHVSDGAVLGSPLFASPSRPIDRLHFVSDAYPPSQHWMTDEYAIDEPHMPTHRYPPPPPPPTWERVIGRISAWTCTILYITSRLPQIWTNLQRRSVQGLSILLFISAATGNLLYTISILINPRAHTPPSTPAARTTYLMESLPFLLGSGGTLIFDAIIVSQWLAWRGKPPRRNHDGVQDEGGEAGRTIVDGLPSMLPSTGSYLFHGQQSAPQTPTTGRRSRKTSTRSQWHSLERQPLLE